MEEKIILGLDVSTTTIGICLMSYKNGIKKILKLTHVTPKISAKKKGIEVLFLKKNIFENEFLKTYLDYGITDVIIEEPLLNSNNIYTVATLLKFNGMISESVFRLLGIIPEYISSHDARKYSFPELLAVRKFNKKGVQYPFNDIKKSIYTGKLTLFGEYPWDVAKKNVMLSLVSDNYPEIEWIYNNKGELKKENFDASDACICVLGYINRTINGEITPIISNISETENSICYTVSAFNNSYTHKI